jgi:ribosomal-protein-alanine N-acetyltransferase
MRSSTRLRLIEPTDAAPIAAHRARDVEAFRPWEPARPADFFTPEGQSERIDRLLAGYRAGTVWPGVVPAEDQVIGEVTVQGILPQPQPAPRLPRILDRQHRPEPHLGRQAASLSPNH